MDSLAWSILFWFAAGVLAYSLCGYQILLLVLGRRSRTLSPPGRGQGEGAVALESLQPEPVREQTLTPTLSQREREIELPEITLIIPAYNEAAVLREKLENALAVDYPRDKLEILVASDGSSDETNQIAESFSDRGVHLLAFPRRRGKASVLNDAAAAAAREVLCLCDANVMFRPDALRVLARHMAEPRVGAVTGDVRLASEESNFGAGESLYYRLERRLQLAESNVGSLMGVDGGMFLIRKELFRKLPADTILDDFVLTIEVIRQGFKVVYEPEAVADESGTPTARQEYRRRRRVSAGAVQSLKRGIWPGWRRPIEMWQYLSHKLLRWFTPLWLLLLLVASIMLWESGWFYQAALIAQLAWFAVAAVGLVIVPARAVPLVGIPFYFMLSQVGLVDGMIRGLFNRQSVTWQPVDRTAGGRQAQESVHG